MDLNFFAGNLLSKTEIGKNLSILPARLNKFHEFAPSITLETLLSFQENHIENLYTYSPESSIFQFEHKDGEYIAQAKASLDPSSVDFTAAYLDDLVTEYGISYVGSIIIEYEDRILKIKVPGELSYDPASRSDDKMWVDAHQINKLVVFLCVLVKAALLGANSRFLRKLYVVMKPIITKHYKKTELFNWIYTQVKFACIKKRSPPNYAKFLGEMAIENENDTANEQIREYLSNCKLLKEGQIQEVLPPQEYFSEIRSELAPVGENAERMESPDNCRKSRYSQNDEMMCGSPDFDEDSVPSVKEILDDLYAVRNKYEKEVYSGLQRIQKLDFVKKKNSVKFTIEEPFRSQCPIF